MSYEVNKIDLLAVKQIKGIGNKTIIDIINKYGDNWQGQTILHEILTKYYKTINKILNISQQEIDDAYNRARKLLIEHEEKDIHVITYLDSQFPDTLKTINNPPTVIYVKGNIDCIHPDNSIAIIGTRQASHYGKEVGYRIGKTLAEEGFVIVSGLALGCDTVGHKGCLKGGGKTIAVLAHGLQTIYPVENKKLAGEILESGGCLISEYPYGHPIYRNNFVERDRLQSALSKAIIVIETDVKGGTMHTVRFSLEQNKILACINHSLEHKNTQSRGNEKLIAEGKAIPITDKNDLNQLIEQIKLSQQTTQEIDNEKQLLITFEENQELAITPLTGIQLARRLGVSSSAISNNKKKGNQHLMKWSKDKDPEGMAWQYSEENKKYIVVS
ncbi:DNA-processing protein DprA [Cyanobacterium sp. Dongsha4]|uniref:DNA-processing protein DprA n=1 Tax=Cyanobacterium sp. DS4 TaxID=2878255 RepID=UPI002E806AF7|nr:DNA-processing protein DprA [Cyanobacterium sp. Dongsha4]WVL00447.1 DNA-processing protein DprA [Cyanobacterium sp. Dongsha4]